MHTFIHTFYVTFIYIKSGPHYTLYYSACLQGPEEVGWGARGGLWWGLTSPWMIQQDVPRVPDLLTKAWPIWIHKHAQQTGVHIGTPQSLSYGNNAVGNLGPALVVDTLRWPLTSSPGPTPPFLHFIIIIIIFNSPSASTQTISSKWNHCSTDTVWQKQWHPPSLPCVMCPTFAHHLHPSIFSPPASRHSGLMSDKLRSSTYSDTPDCFNSHPTPLPPPNCTWEKFLSTSNFPGVLAQRQRIYP